MKVYLVLLLALVLAVEGTSLRHKKHAASMKHAASVLRKRKHFPAGAVDPLTGEVSDEVSSAVGEVSGEVVDTLDPPGNPAALLAQQETMRAGRGGAEPASSDADKAKPDIEDTTGPVAVDDEEGKIVVPQPLGDALKPLTDAAIGALKSVAGALAAPVGTYTVATDRLSLGLFGACVFVLAAVFEENRLERKQAAATLARTNPARSGKKDVDFAALAEELNRSVIGVSMMMVGTASYVLSMFLVNPAQPWVLGWNEKAIGQAVGWTVACLASILLLFSYDIKGLNRGVEADGLPSSAYPLALLFVVGWIVGSVLTGLDGSLSGTVPNGYRMGLAMFGLVCILVGTAYNYIHRFRSNAYKIYNGGALMIVVGWFCAVYSQSIVDNSELAAGGPSTAPILGVRFIVGFVGVVLLAHGFNVCETAKDKNADRNADVEGQAREGSPELPWKGLAFFLCGWSLWILSAWLYPPTPTMLGVEGTMVEEFGCSTSCTRPVAILVLGVLLCFLRSGLFTARKPKSKWALFLEFDDTNHGAVVDFNADSGKVANQLFLVIAWFGFATAIALSDSDELSMAYVPVCWIFASMMITALHMLEKLRIDAHRPEHLFNFAQPMLITGLLGLNFVNAINH